MRLPRKLVIDRALGVVISSVPCLLHEYLDRLEESPGLIEVLDEFPRNDHVRRLQA
jgi:hypothetical protein